ncbi:MAG: hypothetical protein VYE73_03340 [Acidobacteriota bacterium]|nr:hypothetical protein [Acidobacteriota bacterium]
MRERKSLLAAWVATAVAIGIPATLCSQAGDATTGPRTSWGDPDLQGIYTSATYTPLERPKNLADKEFLTEDEYQHLNGLVTGEGVDPLRARGVLTTNDHGERLERLEQADPTHYDNAIWLATEKPRGLSTRRTSLITDPPHGRVPARTEAAKERAERLRELRSTDSYENRPLAERCMVWRHEGPPMVPASYNDLYQIFQTEHNVVIVQEMNINGPRIIPLDGQPHSPASIPLWRGDSRGQWKGDTLVVETRNYSGRNPFYESSESLHVVERFRRVDAETIHYEFTVSDADAWEHAWSAEFPLMQREGPLYEYACHEGNYDIRHILEVARHLDEQAAKGSG